MLAEPVAERIEQGEIAIHVLVFDERAAHDDLRNQNQRDDIGRGFRIGHKRGNDQPERHPAHRSHEHDPKIDPKHPADLEDVIADQNEEHRLDEREHAERDAF